MTYKCENCGLEFERGWTDEEALAECAKNFREVPAEGDRAWLCDDCYEAFLAWMRSSPDRAALLREGT